MTKKIRVGVLFGGKSVEHEVSLLSAKNVMNALDKDKYEIFMIGIDKNGEWHLRDGSDFLSCANHPKQIQMHSPKEKVMLVAKADETHLVSLSNSAVMHSLDVVFPVLHGTYGEDGSIQGLLKMAGIPFVGASVLGSAIGMDKDVMKRLLRDAGIPIARFITYHAVHREEILFDQVVEELGIPLFIKPANCGSSVGVAKATNASEFLAAIEKAFLYDRKILVEEFVQGREIECAVLGNDYPITSLPGEVIPKDQFNSYDAKYVDDAGTLFKTPADLDPITAQNVQELAVRTFQVLCCEGMARVDFFLKQDGQIFVNEINTIPGFTKLSMYPQLWQGSGHPFNEIVDRLIHLARERHLKEQTLKTSVS